MNRHSLLTIIVLFAASAASAQELTERAVFKGDNFRYSRVVLSADSKILACNSGGGLKLWYATTGKEKVTLEGCKKTPEPLAFSLDGKYLASANYEDFHVWDVASHQLVRTYENSGSRGDWNPSAAFSSDGKRVAAANSQVATVWNLASGKELESFSRKGYNYSRRFFSGDLSAITWANFQEIDVLDLATGKLRTTFSEHRGEVSSLAYSGDGKTLLAASSVWANVSFNRVGDVKLWDVATGKERIAFQGPFGRVSQLALSPDGKIAAVLDAPDIYPLDDLKLLDTTSGRTIAVVRHPPGHYFSYLAFRAGKLFVVSSDETTLTLWEVPLPK